GDMGDIPSAVPVRGPVGDVGAEDPAADCALEAARGPWLDRGADDLQPGPVGRSSLALPAPAPEDLDAMARGVLGKLVRQVGLADARLPDQQDEAAAAASAWSSATVGSASSTLRPTETRPGGALADGCSWPWVIDREVPSLIDPQEPSLQARGS